MIEVRDGAHVSHQSDKMATAEPYNDACAWTYFSVKESTILLHHDFPQHCQVWDLHIRLISNVIPNGSAILCNEVTQRKSLLYCVTGMHHIIIMNKFEQEQWALNMSRCQHLFLPLQLLPRKWAYCSSLLHLSTNLVKSNSQLLHDSLWRQNGTLEYACMWMYGCIMHSISVVAWYTHTKHSPNNRSILLCQFNLSLQ